MGEFMKPKGVKCDPNEVAVKSFFLGPAAENAKWLESTLGEIFESWFTWRRKINSKDSPVISPDDQKLAEFVSQQNRNRANVQSLLRRFEDEIPKFSPRYIGHMFSEISMPALLGHFITLLHNPNNISAEASKVGTEIEQEAIELLGQIAGYKKTYGHFTSGGTVANFEFLFRARERLALWLAHSLAVGRKDAMLSAHLGWTEFHKVQRNSEGEDFKRFYILDRARDAFANIKKASGREMGDPILIVPWSKHYSWPKAMHYLGLGESNIRYIKLDRFGRANPEDLRSHIQTAIKEGSPILGVVAVAGTTEMGTVDPIEEMADVIEDAKKTEGLNIWFHVDGAYGGFFRSLVTKTKKDQVISEQTLRSLTAMERSNSVTLDPHKLGYVPYSSGAFIAANEEDYFIRSFTGPYIVSDDKNLGNYTLEGSRSAAGAVATYTSIKSFNSIQGYAKLLGRAISSKLEFQKELSKNHAAFFIPEGLDTNILCFTPAGTAKRLSQINAYALKLYESVESSHEYWISKTTLSSASFTELVKQFCESRGIQQDCDELVLLRLTLMNPFTVTKESSVDHVEAFCTLLSKKLADIKKRPDARVNS